MWPGGDAVSLSRCVYGDMHERLISTVKPSQRSNETRLNTGVPGAFCGVEPGYGALRAGSAGQGRRAHEKVPFSHRSRLSSPLRIFPTLPHFSSPPSCSTSTSSPIALQTSDDRKQDEDCFKIKQNKNKSNFMKPITKGHSVYILQSIWEVYLSCTSGCFLSNPHPLHPSLPSRLFFLSPALFSLPLLILVSCHQICLWRFN